MNFEASARILDEFAANIEAGLLRGRGGPVSDERLAAMREHLKRFVDQEALYAVWSAKEARVARYLAGLLRANAAAGFIPIGDDDPTRKEPIIEIL